MFAVGLIAVVIAVVLMLFEAHASTGGLVGALAVCALVGGVALLLSSAAVGVLAVVAVSGGVSLAGVGGLVMLARRLRPDGHARPRSGVQAMVGHLGVIRAEGSQARVFVDGALWRIQPSPLEGETNLQDGDRVVIEYVNGLTLHVRKAEELELNR
jgi:membrane protein implicated in regulation of membrane protease activity